MTRTSEHMSITYTHFSDCPPCYTLVLEKVREHRAKLEDLRSLIDTIGRNPQAINDTNFHETLRAVNESVNALLRDARDAIGM